MKLFNAMATVAGMTAFSRIAGFIRDIMMAAILGAGPVADAFFVALKLPNFFRRVTAEGAFSVSFVPIYASELATEGEESAALFANRVFSLMLWGLFGFSVLAILVMPSIISLIAPGFLDDPEKYDMAVGFSRITFPYLLLMSLTSLLGGVMNAHDKFAPFAFAPVLFNLSLIGALFLSGFFENAGLALAWGVAAAGVFQFLLLLVTAKLWIGFRLKIVRPQMTPRIKRLFRLMGPGLIGAGVVQINLFADMIIGSFLPTGSISYLYYADRLNQLPLSTVGIAVGTALLPMLSRAVAAKKHDVARHLFSRALEITLFLGLPAALALVLVAEPIISVLFQRGEFAAEAARATAFVLQGYVIGLPAYIAVKVFSTAFWSQQDTVTPVKISAIVVIVNVVLSLSLIPFVGVAGISLSTGLVGWLHLYLLARPLRGHPDLYPDEKFRVMLPKIIVSTVIMGGALFLAGVFLTPYALGPGGVRYAALAGLVATGLISYGLAVQMTGAFRFSDLKRYLSKQEQP